MSDKVKLNFKYPDGTTETFFFKDIPNAGDILTLWRVATDMETTFVVDQRKLNYDKQFMIRGHDQPIMNLESIDIILEEGSRVQMFQRSWHSSSN